MEQGGASGTRGKVWGGEVFAKAARPGASLLPSPGHTSQQPCAQGSSDCRKQCDPDYYLDRDGRCKACVTCSGGKGLLPGSRGSWLRIWGWGALSLFWDCSALRSLAPLAGISEQQAFSECPSRLRGVDGGDPFSHSFRLLTPARKRSLPSTCSRLVLLFLVAVLWCVDYSCPHCTEENTETLQRPQAPESSVARVSTWRFWARLVTILSLEHSQDRQFLGDFCVCGRLSTASQHHQLPPDIHPRGLRRTGAAAQAADSHG